MQDISPGPYRPLAGTRAGSTSYATTYVPSPTSQFKRIKVAVQHKSDSANHNAVASNALLGDGTSSSATSTGKRKHDEEADHIHEEHGKPRAGSANGVSDLLPLPLPEHDSAIQTSRTTAASKAILERDRRPHSDRPPRLATSLGHSRVADFRPWTGDGPEDVISESTIRNGYSEKTGLSAASESNMARPLIWGNLKNKAVLPALSSLFVQVMDKRQALGKCTAPSTFKPPPRVTLTDNKREAWLRELAGTEVPLKRLSRTIPHGIRNRVLLDQCLSKHVPLARAIWLVKCVGSNELRANRRKGIIATAAHAGDVKWIREWTICVEQFLTTAIGQCGAPEWQINIRYVVRLVAALFAEDLLDRNIFLDYLATSFQQCSIDHLPIWMLLVSLFWDSLVRIQSRGRRFATALLEQLRKVHALPAATGKSLSSKMRQLVQRLVLLKPACFLPVQDHAAFTADMSSLLDGEPASRLHHAVRLLSSRAQQASSSPLEVQSRLKSDELHLFEILDGYDFTTDYALAFTNINIRFKNKQRLVSALTRWACSVHRRGSARLYLAMRLIRQTIETHNEPLETAVLGVLRNGSMRETIDPDLYVRLIAGLVLTRHFAVGAYLQWLVATGTIYNNDPIHRAILTAVPANALDRRTDGLRQAILGRLAQDIVTSHDNASSSMDQDRTLDERLTILRDSESNAWDKLSTISFIQLRSSLEMAKDFSNLQSLLSQAIAQGQFDVLEHCAAILLCHAQIFNAMGTLDILTAALYRRHIKAREAQSLSRIWISILLDLCKLQPAFTAHEKRLEQDLALSAQQHAAAVCSPASDSLLNVQSGEITSDADIDRILTSGNIMDETILARLFSAIVERTVKWTAAGTIGLAAPCRWFEMLKVFDPATFDRHMHKLIDRLAANAGTDQVRGILIALISSGCMSIEDALKAFVKRLDALETSNAASLPRFAVGTLQTFLPLSDLDQQLQHPEIYRFRTLQQLVCNKNTELLLRLVWHGMVHGNEAANVVFSANVIDWIHRCCASNLEQVMSMLRFGQAVTPIQMMKQDTLVNLLTGHSQADSETEEASATTRVLLDPDELNVLYVRLVVKQLSGKLARQNKAGNQGDSRLTALEGVLALKNGSMPLWSQVADIVDLSLRRDLYREACHSVLGFYSETSARILPEQQDKAIVHLRVAALTASQDDHTQLQILERVATVLQLFHDGRAADINDIALIIQLAIISVSILEKTPANSTVLSRVLQQLLSLNKLDAVVTKSSLRDLQHDCASLVASKLTSEQLNILYRKLPEADKHDPWIKYLLDIEDADSKWLQLASKVPIATPMPNTTSPIVQQGSASGSAWGSMGKPTSSPMPSPRTPSGIGISGLGNSWNFSSGAGTSTPLASPVPGTPGGLQPPPTTSAGPSQRSGGSDTRYTPFALRRWEMIGDPTPVVGENDTCLSLGLFGARRVL